MRIALALLAGVMGAAAGAMLGFYIPAYACLLIDKLTGMGLIAVGWIVCFATIPYGAFYGAVFSFQVAYRMWNSE